MTKEIFSPVEEKRGLIIDSYLSDEATILPEGERISEKLTRDIEISVVVPTYCEEKTICNLLAALNKQQYRQFEVIIVDNGSKDDTISTVLTFRPHVNYPLYLLKETKPGAGNARKTGMDEVIRRVRERDSDKISRHFIAITDADVIPPSNWLEEIIKTFKTIPSGAISGTHGGSRFIDEIIEDRLGLPNFFNRAPQLARFLQQKNIGQIRIRGPNSAFEIEAYAAAGGFQQPCDIQGKTLPRECMYLTKNIRKKGYPIIHLNVHVVSSQRRHLFELISGIDSYALVNDFDGRFIGIRKDEKALLEEALKKVPKEKWISYQKRLLRTIIQNTILGPLIEGEIKASMLTPILDRNNIKQLVGDLGKLSRLEMVEKWADFLIKASEKRMKKEIHL